MAEEAKVPEAVAAPSADSEQLRPEQNEVKEVEAVNGNMGDEVAHPEGAVGAITDALPQVAKPEGKDDKQTTSNATSLDKPAATQEDIKMTGTNNQDDTAQAVDEPTIENDDEGAAGKAKSTPRRKSSGVPEHKKKLNKKASKAKMTHTDAQPGDYFYVRLKGYPLWPAIVCDESMLPQTLLKSRPVTAMRSDGTYREDYQDGGAKVKDRTFAVMYLHTNEFGWIPNYDLLELDFETVGQTTPKMRKDLALAHALAAEQHPLDYFKDMLHAFMEQKDLERKEAIERENEKAEKAANKRLSKKPSKAALAKNNEDVEMPDATADADSGDAAPSTSKKAKRPRDEESNPSDSSKKVKLNIKLTNTPKTNGTPTPKPAKDSASTKPPKTKSSKKAAPKVVETPEAVVLKEPEQTAEEKHQKKEKEILFLRHKLQKGLLTRDQVLKEEDMKQMSDFVSKLEGYADLEVSIIRVTKINKVLKAIIKLPSIPKEEEYHFKTRSQTLLDKWNKLLATEVTPVATAPPTNGTSELKKEGGDAKTSPVEPSNGVKPSIEDKAEEKLEPGTASEPAASEVKDEPTAVDSVPAPVVEEDAKESVAEPAVVESTA